MAGKWLLPKPLTVVSLGCGDEGVKQAQLRALA
jgi:hypothetical protein